MTDPILSERADALADTRPELLAFAAAFVIGLVAYFGLRSFRAPQWAVTGAVIAVMLAYAFVVTRIPRLRVRLDQAGDNAYYLGLLFTLVSMAVALSEFGSATYEAAGAAHPS